jgi:hypothetical protein
MEEHFWFCCVVFYERECYVVSHIYVQKTGDNWVISNMGWVGWGVGARVAIAEPEE